MRGIRSLPALVLLALLLAWTTSAALPSSSRPQRRDSAASSCAPNGPSRIVDGNTRRAVGATSLAVNTANVDLLSSATVVEFDPPFDPPAEKRGGSCLCSAAFGLQCVGSFLFVSAPLPESLVGHNITARVGVNGTFVTNWTRVATVMPAPVLVASNTTQVPQYAPTFTVHGRYLGLPTTTSTSTTTAPGDFALTIFFKDANGTAVDGVVQEVSDDATSASVIFTSKGPRVMGPLWASADLWGVLTDYVQVATVVEAKPDATSTLFCSGQFGDTSIQVGTQLSCVVNIQTNRQPIAGSLDDFSIFLGAGSHGLLGKTSLRPDGRSIYFAYTAPSSRGFEQLHVTFNVSSEIVGSPFNITVWESKPDSDDVPWHIIIPVLASAVGALVIALIVGWLVVRWRRQYRYEMINEFH